jgi:hypothetical protein
LKIGRPAPWFTPVVGIMKRSSTIGQRFAFFCSAISRSI